MGGVAGHGHKDDMSTKSGNLGREGLGWHRGCQEVATHSEGLGDGWMVEWLDSWMVGRLDGWMVGGGHLMVGRLDGWRVGWLDGWYVRWLDGWIAGMLDGWMVG